MNEFSGDESSEIGETALALEDFSEIEEVEDFSEIEEVDKKEVPEIGTGVGKEAQVHLQEGDWNKYRLNSTTTNSVWQRT